MHRIFQKLFWSLQFIYWTNKKMRKNTTWTHTKRYYFNITVIAKIRSPTTANKSWYNTFSWHPKSHSLYVIRDVVSRLSFCHFSSLFRTLQKWALKEQKDVTISWLLAKKIHEQKNVTISWLLAKKFVNIFECSIHTFPSLKITSSFVLIYDVISLFLILADK